jgi:hypothetical protein
MKSTTKRPFLDRASSIVWAVIAAAFSIILLFFLGEAGFAFLFGSKLGEPLAFIIYGLILGISSFIICRHNPKSLWYVLIILNILNVLSLIGEYRNIIGTIVNYMTLAILLSIIGGFWGANKGKKELVVNELQANI